MNKFNEEGRQAFAEGKQPTDCPYLKDSKPQLWSSWVMGYAMAKHYAMIPEAEE